MLCFLGGPTVPIKSRLPSSGSRTPPRVTRTENKNDDKLFEFLNSNVPTSKERKPTKPKLVTETSSDEVVKANDTSLLVQQDAPDGRINDGEHVKKLSSICCPTWWVRPCYERQLVHWTIDKAFLFKSLKTLLCT